ncbi:MAG: hypothetical protein AB7V16_12015 [Vulcanibacillus sp.]
MYFKGVNPVKAFIKDPQFAWEYFFNWGIRVSYSKITGNTIRSKHYAGREVLSSERGNKLLTQAIVEGKPYMAGRFGNVELGFIIEALLKQKDLLKELRDKHTKEKCINCGFFPPTHIMFLKFKNEMLQSIQQCDLMCVWYNIMEDYLIKKYLSNESILTHRNIFDFWQFDVPFTYALKGKKVLVVSPFDTLIKNQYSKRELLFSNSYVLPAFDLTTIKAVQTSGGATDDRFSDWFEALDYMYNEAMKLDFDIAILGCGAYGYPLAAKLKQAGKIAIHMGGVTQILFGIKGARWDVHPQASKLYNEYWVRPTELDKPKNADSVEDGCYW